MTVLAVVSPNLGDVQAISRLHHGVDQYKGFSGRYRVDRLLYFEEHASPSEMVRRERQLKGWVRRKKLELIEAGNAGRRDLAEGWFDEGPGEGPGGPGGGK